MLKIICNNCKKLIKGDYLHLKLRNNIVIKTFSRKSISIDCCSKRCLKEFIKTEREINK